MGVYHRGVKLLMAQEFLNCPDVIPLFNEIRGKTVPEGINRGMLCYPRPVYSRLKSPLKTSGMYMIVI